MKLFQLALIPLLLAPMTAAAHDYWIEPSSFSPSAGSAVVIRLCANHKFPQCGDFDFPENYKGLQIAGPDGGSSRMNIPPSLESGAGGKWTAAAGRHAFTMQLITNHPRRGEVALYTTRAVVDVPGGNGTGEAQSGTGKGLEIFLDQVSSESMTLRVLHDGRPAQTTLQVQPEAGRKFTLNTDRNGQASMQPPVSGRYLISTSNQGVSGSLHCSIPK